MDHTAPVEVHALPVVAQPADIMPGRNGGTLKRGNPGNKGGRKSVIARQILEAATPRAARILAQMALQGTMPTKAMRRKKGAPVTDKPEEVELEVTLLVQDRVKALTALLDRGGAPVRTEITGADGAAFVVAVRAATADD